ncbi:hypothetical protein ACWCPM_33895 [Streptomyces sp. NPDC002309]
MIRQVVDEPLSARRDRADCAFDDRRRCTLVDCADLDQSLSALTEALAEYGGARFETAPREGRAPIPVTVSGAEPGVPDGERSFVTRRGEGVRTAVWATLGCGSVLSLAKVDDGYAVGHEAWFSVSVFGVIGFWILAIRSWRRRLRPLRLRVGHTGIGMREVTRAELRISWTEDRGRHGGTSPGRLRHRPLAGRRPLPGADLPVHPPTSWAGTGRTLRSAWIACPAALRRSSRR